MGTNREVQLLVYFLSLTEPEVPADVVDCMVTPWSEWTSCTKTCGKSYQFKTRMVKREPENGGKACPPRLKKRNKCDVPKCEGKVSSFTGSYRQGTLVNLKSRARIYKRDQVELEPKKSTQVYSCLY